ncbi:hypothetical protein SD70_08560 [Gordoniibacillus kamchatkensis]|uniref:DUF2500 domain-containing protein n=1 Tax=Gordoniibacillus kamchatkensis TaxID=1590651 RepID=A0ABR5AJZ6_9BACL|nr:DUF2500 domain-containing protein [Paenibacillus sp. VKM B-2647]KIL41285.1 hypothetical protein SD70_08560 [Paenibacillus sp. VKM B-2647]
MQASFGGPPPLFQFMFVLIPTIVVVGIGYVIISSFVRWARNNASPVLTREAAVVAKRSRVRGGGETGASTSYFATFELEDSSRIELPLKGRAYGLLAEGDRGMLTYQGTRYLGFERRR